MSIGQRLKEARLSRHMTQEDLARAVGVTKGAIGNYETEVSSPKESILIKLMEVLHIDANFLYQDFIRRDSCDRSEDLDLLEALHQNPTLRLLFDKQKTLGESDLNAVLAVVNAISKERDPDV